MRTLWLLIRVTSLATLVATKALAQSLPPPPPPAANLPTEIDGYAIIDVRDNYHAWITSRMGLARDQALSIAPMPADFAGYYPMGSGPGVRVVSQDYADEDVGYELQINRWCARSGQACAWLARMATVPDGASVRFLNEHFDAELAVASLRQRGIEPASVRSLRAQSYDLPDPLTDVLAHVSIRHATDTDCPAIAEAAAVARHASRTLEFSYEADRDAPPPPPAPHAYLFRVTLPAWHAREAGDRSPQSDAEVTLTDLGRGRVRDLVEAIVAPLRSCQQLR